MSAFYRVPPELHRSVCEALLSDESNIDPEGHIPNPGLGTRTVAILARTSRWLCGPAADALWRTIPNVALLLYTMPDNCYKQMRNGKYTRFVGPAGGRSSDLLTKIIAHAVMLDIH